MLGDDLIDGTKATAHWLGHAAKNAVRGALLVAAIVAVAMVGYAVLDGVMAGAALEAGKNIPEAVWGRLSSLFTEAGGTLLDNTIVGGYIGGAVAGVASLLPGRDEGFGLSRLFKRRERSPAREQEPVQEVSQQAQPAYAPGATRPEPATSFMPSPGAAPCHPTTIVDNSQRTQVYHTDAPTYTATDASRYEQNNSFEQNNVANATTLQADAAPALARRQQPAFPAENPYFREGRGAEAMRRGNEAGRGDGRGA